jgi:GTP-binding protein YchF
MYVKARHGDTDFLFCSRWSLVILPHMPALQLYLIGPPRSGKSSVFCALTDTAEGHHAVTKGTHHLGIVKVPDVRLVALRDMYKPKKFTPAEVTFVDVAIPPAPEGVNPLTQLVAFLGEADAFAVVVQAFGDLDYRGRPPDPAAQLQEVHDELVFSDLEKVTKRLEKIAHEERRGQKALPMEISGLEKCRPHLESGRALRSLVLAADEEKALRSFQFLSQKPIMVIANVPENNLAGAGLDSLRERAQTLGAETLVFCAPLEAEMAQLDDAAQKEFLKEYGLKEPARDRLIAAAYRLLDLISFFTVGEDEVRAWTIRRGTAALDAAGKIHTDLQRGFIRAEVVRCEDLLKAGSWAACQKNATLRLEGKNYVVQDGDVMHIRFNA